MSVVRTHPKTSLLISVTLSLLIMIAATLYAFQRASGSATSTITQGASTISVVEAYEGQPDNFTAVAQRSDLVVEVVVQDILPSKWATRDGKAPTPKLDSNGLRSGAPSPDEHVRTPVRVSVERVLKGQYAAPNLVISFIGGRVGDTAFVSDELKTFTPGTRMIVFLSKAQPGSAPDRVAAGSWVPSLPLVVDGAMVHGPLKDVPLAEVVQQIQQAQ